MLGLTLVALFGGHDAAVVHTVPHHTLAPEIEVTVRGAVQKPGSYQVKRGATVEEVLSQAVPMSNADMRKIKRDKILRQGQIITVPEIQMITVHLAGAVDTPKTVSIPKGSVLSDLIPLLEFQTDANIQQLQKKRRLKDGETITVKRTKGTKR